MTKVEQIIDQRALATEIKAAFLFTDFVLDQPDLAFIEYVRRAPGPIGVDDTIRLLKLVVRARASKVQPCA